MKFNYDETINFDNLNEDQLKRVAENNEINDQFCNQEGGFHSRVELEQMLKNLGVKDPTIQINRMMENAWTSIVYNEPRWKSITNVTKKVMKDDH